MSDPVEVFHHPVLQLLTGHFREASGYRAYRRGGVGDWLVIYTVSGQGRFGHPDGELVAGPGDWVLLRPGTRHDYGVDTTVKRWELIWAHFQPRAEWQRLLAWPPVHGGLMRLRIDGSAGTRIARRFSDVHKLRNTELPHRDMVAMNALEDVFLQCDRQNAPARRGDERVRKALDYMEQHIDRKLSLNTLAAAVGLSPSRLAHLFSAESGQTPQRYLEGLRMQRAADLLERTSFSVKQIAGAVGFDNPLYFSLRFKAFTHSSPTEFRQENAQAAGQSQVEGTRPRLRRKGKG